ncbi:hypothetical protein B0H63DRAFT_473494 [Podospora didyma]|uniref:Uncharacterized protein n=1 Tax=Podospora didyma TaxID=330526 RepID=A0AAE0NQC8_9PEZI|nr:hypothetical protein B0H63DRAFT_473494 [Podospora didyma]
MANIPSCVVDWTQPPIRLSLGSSSGPLPARIRFRASGDRTSSLKQGRSQREIEVRGQYFDKIQTILPSCVDWKAPEMSFLFARYPDNALALAKQQCIDGLSPYAGNQPLEEAVWRTLIGDRTLSVRQPPSHYVNSIKIIPGLLKDPIWRGASGSTTSISSILIARKGTVSLEEANKNRLAIEAYNDVVFLNDGGNGHEPHAFCATEKGYIAMVPRLSRAGDSIGLIYGRDAPFVLRGDGNNTQAISPRRYQLVGDAYVHGIMDGRRWRRDRMRILLCTEFVMSTRMHGTLQGFIGNFLNLLSFFALQLKRRTAS